MTTEQQRKEDWFENNQDTIYSGEPWNYVWSEKDKEVLNKVLSEIFNFNKDL